jgi:hypothetical protein
VKYEARRVLLEWKWQKVSREVPVCKVRPGLALVNSSDLQSQKKISGGWQNAIRSVNSVGGMVGCWTAASAAAGRGQLLVPVSSTSRGECAEQAFSPGTESGINLERPVVVRAVWRG